MVIKTRSELKKTFLDNTVPLPQDFFNLLDSVLLKADDQFFGKWRPGYAYKPGDVVLHCDKLFTFTGKPSTEPNKDCDCGGGNQPPGGQGCWAELRIDVNDHDWEIVRDDKKHPLYMYAAVYGKIGIGTKEKETPQAFLHLNDDKSGGGSQFLFNPIGEGNDYPMFKMKKSKYDASNKDVNAYDQTADFVTQSIGEQTSKKQCFINETNTVGFLFKKLYQPGNESPTGGGLLFITSNGNQANLGVGTDEPEGMLDIQNGNEKRILLNPNDKQEPEMILINLDETNMHNYLAHSVSTQFALLSTNAKGGFMFRKGIGYEDFVHSKNNDETGESVMVIDTQSGNVGIGTETPTMRLQVEGKAGKVQVNLDELNPSINIIDPRPRKKSDESPTYLAVGAADDVSVLSTNAKKGFVFKRGTDMTTVNDKIKLGDSNGILKLYPQDFENSQYNALLDGYAVAKGFYVRPAPFKVNGKWKTLTKSLARLSELSPVEFQYEGRPDETHYGFEIEDMVNNVIDATLQLPNDAKVIAYQNLVTMLVGAVKELNTNVENVTRRVLDLEKKVKK